MAWSLLSLLVSTGVPAIGGAPDTVRDWETVWTAVLERNVDEAGRVDFASLDRNRADLDRVVQFVAANDPGSRPSLFPTRAAKLAYFINAYNALAMHGVVEAGLPDSLGGIRKFTFFYLRKFTIGGKQISLYDFENSVIRPMGEERVHFALNCMVVSCPRLPRYAFTAAKLDQQLGAAARSFIGEVRNVKADPASRTIWLSSIFKFYTDDFLASAPDLVAYVNKYRTDTIPAGFAVRFLDYDWAVNDRSRSGAR